MSYRKSLKSCALATSSAAVIGMALSVGAAAPAFAQEAGVDDRVVVTGSRIQRRDFQANSPIVTVDAQQFESQTGLNVEAYLNRLPQFNPAATPVTAQAEVQVTAVNSAGIASVSLRGLGPNRNLVLVDGKRLTPVNALMVTDLNAIPSALIQRVEIITGGASAVYGADAVGGVVNFILRDNYEGLELDTQYGFSEAGDGEEFRISGVVGANVANGRGNVTLGVEHYSRSAAYARNRQWRRDEWANPLLASPDLFPAGVHGFVAQGAANPVDQGVVESLFPVGERPAGTSVCTWLGCTTLPPTFTFNADGTVWINGPNAQGGMYRYNGPIDGEEYAWQTVYTALDEFGVTKEGQALKWNNPNALTSSPQTRYSLFASGNYDITDTLTFFARATFAESRTATNLFPSPAIGGWEVLIPYDPATDSPIIGSDLSTVNPGFIPTGADGAGHPVTPELAALLNSRPNASAPWQLNFIPSGWFADRSLVNTVSTWQFEAGLRGELPFRDWTWEGYVSHGQSNTYNIGDGYFSLERYRAMMSAPDYGRNAFIPGNQDAGGGPAVRPGFGLAPGVCTSGFYDTIFGGDVAPSEDCTFSISAPLQSRTQIQQTVAELNVQGGLFELPAGELRGAFGVQYRENGAQYYPDLLQSMRSFNDQVIGVYPASYMDASTYAREVYGELLIPVLSDLPFIQQFDLEVGARFSNYAQSSDEWTYKILGDWAVNDWLRFRGGYNRATRSPNIGELYLGRQMIFAIQSTFGDPCAIRSTSPFGAGGAQAVNSAGAYGADPNNNGRIPDAGQQPGASVPSLAASQTQAGANSTFLICEAQMGTATADVYYNQATAPAAGTGTSFLWIYQEGNPNLDSEKADTWTFGAVLNSPFTNPWLGGFSASVDWYRVGIKDAIQLYTVNYARALCYGSVIVTNAAEAAAQAATPECQALPRVGGTTVGFAGTADDITLRYDNQATIKTSGVDVAVNWIGQFQDLGLGIPGGLGINVQASILDYYKTKESAFSFDPEINWRGTSGPNLAGTNPGAYDYRLFTSVSYFLDNKSLSLRWRHLPGVWGAGYAVENALFANNQAVADGAEGLILSFTPGNPIAVKTKSYNVFDASFNWDINQTVSLRGGINNLFNINPPRSGGSLGRPLGEWTPADFAAVCDAYGGAPAGGGVPGPLGCVNPSATGWSLPNPGTGTAAFYDVMGRSFFLGLKARF